MKTIYKNTHYAALILLVICLVVSFAPDISDRFPIRKGLDLSGGTRAVLLLRPTPGTPVTRDVQSQVVSIMTARVNGMGVSEALVQAKGSNQIIVEMPQMPGKSVEEQRDILRNLIRPAKLEFIWLKEVKSDVNPAARYEYRGDNTIFDIDTNKVLSEEEVRTQILYDDPDDIIVTGADLKPKGAEVQFSTGPGGGVRTTLEFNQEGSRKFAEFTRNNVGTLLAIVLNGRIDTAPRINVAIEDGRAEISGATTTVPEAQDLAVLLNAGALPVPLEELSSSSVEATLGQSALDSAIVGGIIGILAVALYMLVLYFLPGAVAVIALAFYALLTITAFRLLGVTLTLPGVAGFILSVGMAVDANILIFERLKEEMKAGRTLRAAVDAGFDRAWSSIWDASVASLITCVVLGWYPGPVRGFALVLGLGVIVSLFTAVTVCRALLHLIVSQEWAQDPKWFRLGDPNRKPFDLNVMGRWKLWIVLSLALILFGWSFNVMHYITHGTLTRQGIDFTGGSMITYAVPANREFSDNDVKEVFAANGFEEIFVQRGSEAVTQVPAAVEGAETPEAEAAEAAPEEAQTVTTSLINVRTTEVDDQKLVALEEAMRTQFGAEQKGVDRVGPIISRELTRQAITMVLVAAVLILLYLAYAFGHFGFKAGLRYGTTAFITMIHDVMLMFGFMGFAGYFMNWELNSLFVTAALTVIGFTNHDTIVVFDRIRENSKIHKDKTFNQIANMAINQTLTRSINTSMTVALTLAALLFFGTKGSLDLKVFASVLLVGVVVGVYSSIFFAAPLLAWMETREANKRPASRAISSAETKTFATAAAPKPAPRPEPAAPVEKPDTSANGEGSAPAAPTRRPSSGGTKKSKRRF